jgi:hypothetical protein
VRVSLLLELEPVERQSSVGDHWKSVQLRSTCQSTGTLGRVDGFNQDEAECQGYEGSVVLRGLLASECDAFEALEFADGLLDACPRLVEYFRKNAGLSIAFDLYGMTGQMPRLRAPSRLALASYPLSVMAARGAMSGPRSRRISKLRLSLASPPVK